MTEITLGGGCFWCLDAVYRKIQGIQISECGYAGGFTENPTYEQVSLGRTQHAEVVRMVFDETAIALDSILDLFFLIHNPTTLNQQGADIGTQYRSIMLYANDQQKESFEQAVLRASANWSDPIVTVVEPLKVFYKAEDEHQDYFTKHPESGYCQIVIAPKLIKARSKFKQFFK